uniref:Uncharacterized protein n=1 Tax=Scophthalmus maximus TaxID=52904 RepID=A0A8D3DL82_SCOMX
MLMVRIWRKQHESVDPSCLVSTVQVGGGGVMVWGIFSWHTLGPLVQIEHRLNATAYLSIVADHSVNVIADRHVPHTIDRIKNRYNPVSSTADTEPGPRL